MGHDNKLQAALDARGDRELSKGPFGLRMTA